MARVAKLVLALAGLGLVAGVVGLFVAAGIEDWSDVAEGVRDYALRVQRGQPLLGPLALCLLGIALALLGVSLHRRAAFRRTRTARHRAAVARVELRDLDRGLDRARRRLDRELTRARRDPERALEALFTTLGELEPGAVGLELAPDPSGMAVAVTAELRGKRQALASVSEALMQRIVERLGEMLETRGLARGELEFRGASVSTTIRVEVEELERGRRLRLRQAPDLTGPGRRVIFVARPDRTPIPERSGSYSVDDSTSRESGLLLGLDPTGEEEVAPVVASRERRPVVGLEAALRLLAALVLAACVALAAGGALQAGWRRLRSGERTAPWREVVVQIESLPTGSEVSIDGAPRGQTPLARRELCKGRALSVLISTTGHRTWQWRGICPSQGPLRLLARLQPR